MSWFLLFLAIITEVSGTTCMKLSQGFSRLAPSILVFAFYGVSLTFLTFSLKKIEISVAYAIWSGLGTALIVTIGFIWFRETFSLPKLLFLGMIIIGVIGLQLSSEIH